MNNTINHQTETKILKTQQLEKSYCLGEEG